MTIEATTKLEKQSSYPNVPFTHALNIICVSGISRYEVRIANALEITAVFVDSFYQAVYDNGEKTW